MSETVKFRIFCAQPMGTKPVSEIPGVGPVAARKLRSMDYTKAMDLYNRLKRLNFDQKKFRVWIALNCKGAKVATIYKALMGWQSQFGDQLNDADSGSARAGSPRARPLGRAGRATAAPRRSGNTVQFDLSGTERDNNSFDNDAPRPNNPLSLFFASFSDSCNSISPEFHTEFKMAILNVVSQFERRSRERQSEDAPSTSRATNGGA